MDVACEHQRPELIVIPKGPYSLGSLRQPTVVLYVIFVHNSNVIHTKWRESDESVTVTISR